MDLVAVKDSNLFEVVSVLGVKVRTTKQYWDYIMLKHSELSGRFEEAFLVLQQADAVYKQTNDNGIYLYYKRIHEHTICVVARHLNGQGFVVTAYLTTKAKRKGEFVWQKSAI